MSAKYENSKVIVDKRSDKRREDSKTKNKRREEKNKRRLESCRFES